LNQKQHLISLRDKPIADIINELQDDNLSDANFRVISAALELKRHDEMVETIKAQTASNEFLAKATLGLTAVLGIVTILGTIAGLLSLFCD